MPKAGLLKKVFGTILVYSWAVLVTLPNNATQTVSSQAIQTNQFPEITLLQKGNSLFDQLVDGVATYWRASAQNRTLPELQLFRYKVKRFDTLFTVSARINIPPATIATLNRLSGSDLPENSEIILPSLPGLFVSANPQTRIEQQIADRLRQDSATAQSQEVRFIANGIMQDFLFYLGKDFSPEERKNFLSRPFRTPIAGARISSTFGYRRNPFSGLVVLHAGVDLAAPVGTAVRSIGDGTVDEIGKDFVYGNYLYVNHQNGYRSFYAHLKSIKIRKNQAVKAGDIIGTLGATGQVTGAHLHLELHHKGMVKDPLLYFKP